MWELTSCEGIAGNYKNQCTINPSGGLRMYMLALFHNCRAEFNILMCIHAFQEPTTKS